MNPIAFTAISYKGGLNFKSVPIPLLIDITKPYLKSAFGARSGLRNHSKNLTWGSLVRRTHMSQYLVNSLVNFMGYLDRHIVRNCSSTLATC